jgi:hypothetical protein
VDRVLAGGSPSLFTIYAARASERGGATRRGLADEVGLALGEPGVPVRKLFLVRDWIELLENPLRDLTRLGIEITSAG